MRIKIQQYLQSLANEKYKNFSLKLLPKNTKLLGVRIPLLKKYAKELIKNNTYQDYLSLPLKDLEYQEEKMLYSLLIAYEKTSELKRIENIKKYIPYISNWSECDTFVAALKSIKSNQDLYYNQFQSLTQSSNEYEIRFFYVVSLNYFIDDKHLPLIQHHIKQQKYIGFYDKMAVAWFLSMAYIKYPNEIKQFLKTVSLDTQVFQKTISKINDSYQVTKEAKQELKIFLTS